tara:strand:- start:12363 stop:13397 length:1035 start_codon:yes stop_codon:yes gene_type:complete
MEPIKKTKKRGKHYPYKFSNLKKNASRLGRGFFGETFAMINTIDKKVYAVKHINIKKIQTTLYLLKRKPVTRSSTLEFIFNESKTLALLDHKNIIRYYNTRHTKDTIYISLELMKGGDLEQAIKKKKFFRQPNIMFNILIQICDGLSYLHNKNIIHRDIKASNILLETDDLENPIVKLGDFGLSCLLDGTHYDQKGKGNGAGDIFYRSPEAVSGQPYNEGDDNWAVGIVALELISSIILADCVSGNIFSQYKNFNVYIEQILEDNCMPHEASSYYEKLVFIVRGLLNLDPEKRLTSGTIVNQYKSKTILKNILPPIERGELIKKNSTKYKSAITKIMESKPHSA